MSEGTRLRIDQAIRRIIDEQYAIARTLIEENRDKMHAMAQALLEWETIDAEQINDIMEGRPPRPPEMVQKDGTSGNEKPPPQSGTHPDSAKLAKDIGLSD
jgi:cell division protease FtsH